MFGINKIAVLGLFLGLLAAAPSLKAQIYHVEQNYNLAQASKMISKGKLLSGAKYLKRAVRSGLAEDQLVTALTDLCAIDYHLGKLNSAEKACSRAIRVNRKSWKAYYNRGHVRRALGAHDTAKIDYLKAARIKPEEQRIQNALTSLDKSETNKYAEIHN